MNRIVFDIETEPFSDEFRNAKSVDVRRTLAPAVRVACVYSEVTRRYRFFSPQKAQELIDVLLEADEIISFNGKNFDLLVLQRHYQLGMQVPRNGNHVDLCELVSKQAGFNVSLDRLAKLNLGKGKHTAGREMVNLDVAQLRKACQSDVRQTYKLWNLYTEKTLQVPKAKETVGSWIDNLGGPGNHMPSVCPNCSSKNIELVEWDMEQMSDGQAADYEAGLQGEIYCNSCKTHSDFGF